MRNRIKNKDSYRELMDISEVLEKFNVNKASELFNNDLPFYLEIGFGNGEFLIDHYKNFPKYNYIGIESSDKFSLKTMKKVKDANIKNYSIWNTEAFEAIKKYIDDDLISRLYINFSDPWPKKRHNKRRVINIKFLDEVYRILKKDGFLFIVTDHDDYALDIEKKLKKFKKFKSIYDSFYVNYYENYYQTKYERIMRGEKHNIYYFILRKS